MAQRARLALGLWLAVGLMAAGWAADRDLLAEAPPLPDGWQAEAGRLAITAKGDSRRAQLVALPGDTSGAVSLTWRVTAGSDLRVGLVCLTSIDSGWYAQMRGDGYYWIGQLIAGRPQPRLTGLVPAGRPGEPLSLKLEWQAARQTTWLCGTPLSLPATNLPVTGVALWAAGQGSAEVTTLSLGQPGRGGQGPTTTPPVVPGTTSGGGGTTAVPTPPTPPTPDPTVPTPPQPPVGPGPDGDHPGATVIDPGTGQAGGPPVTPTRPGGIDVPTPPQPGGVVPQPAGVEPPTPGGTEPHPGGIHPQPGGTQPQPGGTQPPALQGAKVLFEDDFDPPKHRWNRDAYRTVEQGGLRLRAEAGYQLSGFPNDFAAVAYSATARSLSADGGTYGLVARLQADGGSGYLFVVREPDQWAIARLDRGASTLLRLGTTPLTGGAHRLTAVCVGEQLALALDGQVLGKVSDGTYAAGGVGVWVDNQRTALFDDLVALEAGVDDLTSPRDRAPQGDPSGTAAAGPLPFEERFAAPRMAWQLDGQRELRDGALWLTSEPGRYVVSGVAEQRYTDYLLTAECEPLTGPEEGRFGLMARLQADGSSGYLLACRRDGGFVVMRLDPSGAVMLSHGAMQLDAGTHRLWARCAGTGLVFGIDGTELARVQDSVYGTGGFGVYADHGAQARFLTLRAEALP